MTERKIPPPSPLFIGAKELAFFNSISKELIQKIIAQKITYYCVSEEHTKVDDLYKEAIRKTVYQPVEMNALVLYNEPQQTVSQFSVDTIYTIEVYLHLHELEERNMEPKVGDFLSFGEVIYEVEKITSPQLVYGQVENKVMRKAVCRMSRKSQFDLV